jgi:hypothetical protein
MKTGLPERAPHEQAPGPAQLCMADAPLSEGSAAD